MFASFDWLLQVLSKFNQLSCQWRSAFVNEELKLIENVIEERMCIDKFEWIEVLTDCLLL